jgi:hypothetical protein
VSAYYNEGVNGRVADADGRLAHWWTGARQVGWSAIEGEVERGGRRYRAQWRVEPGIPLLAYGVPNRVAKCSGFGNAIVPQVAAEFIEAYMTVIGSADHSAQEHAS